MEEGELAAATERGAEPPIVRLLRGDTATLETMAAALGGGDPESSARWRDRIVGLIDAIVGRAIEECALVFPAEHSLWGAFTPEQNRDVALALAALGYRYDGAGGFQDDRVPSRRDLSLAMGYAGIDPMRIRVWPTETEMPGILRDVAVDAGDFLAGAAGGLTLGEMVACSAVEPRRSRTCGTDGGGFARSCSRFPDRAPGRGGGHSAASASSSSSMITSLSASA